MTPSTHSFPPRWSRDFQETIDFVNGHSPSFVTGDVAGLIAPRPFNAISGRTDPIFPIDQVEYAYEKLQRVYEVAGVKDHCQLYIGDGGHRYYKDGAWPFVRKHFA